MATTPSALSKSTIIQKVFENIYDRLADNVSSVTITGSNSITIQTYTNSYGDKNVDEKSDYPILVVNSPEIDWEDFTFTTKKCMGTFSVDILCTQSEAADKFIDAIINSIETYRDDLKSVGMQFVNLEGTSRDQFFRGKIKIHVRSCEFSFEYIFTKSQTR